jgi:cell division protein FtsQ
MIKRYLLSLFLFLLVVFSGYGYWASKQEGSFAFNPVKSYELLSASQQVSEQEIQKEISPFIGTSFWRLPLDQIQSRLVRLDWVAAAEVKRHWPNQIRIFIHEQKPIARWNEDGLINAQGQVFFPKHLTGYENLVRLDGPLDMSADILKTFVNVQAQFEKLGLLVEKMTFESNVWRIQLYKASLIIADNKYFEESLRRFIKAYTKLPESVIKSASKFDLRYSNGFTVSGLE